MSSPASIDTALKTLLSNNFDAVSKPCVITLIKLIDNLLQKPNNVKVRSIRIRNAAFWDKVGSRAGGMDVLLACGFEYEREKEEIGSSNNTSNTEPQFLVLQPDNEDTERLVAARHRLAKCAVHELNMKKEEIPDFKTPIPRNSVTAVAAGTGAFDIYSGHRFDGQAAAIGQQILPGSGTYKSATERQVEILREKERKLQEKARLANVSFADRQAQVFLPGQTQPQQRPSSSSSSSSSTAEPTSGDASLLAAHAAKQAKMRVEAENAAFGANTQAMRELRALKSQKVFSHVQLSVYFPDGVSIQLRGWPHETVDKIISGLREGAMNELTSDITFDLYVTPPRRKLPTKETLQQAGLVPAAKVYVSWTSQVPASTKLGWYLKPDMLQPGSGGATSFPTGTPVVGPNPSTTTAKADDASAAKPKKKLRDRQAEILKRMMGK